MEYVQHGQNQSVEATYGDYVQVCVQCGNAFDSKTKQGKKKKKSHKERTTALMPTKELKQMRGRFIKKCSTDMHAQSNVSFFGKRGVYICSAPLQHAEIEALMRRLGR